MAVDISKLRLGVREDGIQDIDAGDTKVTGYGKTYLPR